MKLVIDIPEEAYSLISGKIDIANIDLYSTLIVAVKNGVPLPKGHGDLVDIDTIYIDEVDFYDGADYERAINAVNIAPTIIEADKE